MSMIRYLPICSVLLLSHGIFLIVSKMVLEKLLCFRFENLFLHELVEGKWLDKETVKLGEWRYPSAVVPISDKYIEKFKVDVGLFLEERH